jgi:hypothetical protein
LTKTSKPTKKLTLKKNFDENGDPEEANETPVPQTDGEAEEPN